MSVVRDIMRMYRSPRAVIRTRMGTVPREDRALAVLLAACTIIFIAQWPVASRQAFVDPSVPLEARLGGALMAWLFIVPLAMYAIGTLSHLVARLVKAHGSAYGARFALFWALLAASPLWLFYGLVAGFIGPGLALSGVGIVALGVFILFWALGFSEAEWG